MNNDHFVKGDYEPTTDGYKPSILSELLCCPFCGADAFIWKHQNGWKISCTNDCVTMPPRFDMGFNNEEEAKKHWNHRAT